jgi:squamous cell carcinoma antigen recognized by T-cells 3
MHYSSALCFRVMDEEQVLEALSNVISALAETPFDLSLHVQHIQLAAATGMDDQVHAARETFTTYYACGDDVWLSLIQDKKDAVDMDTVEGALSVLQTFDRAEGDYLCTRSLRLDCGTRFVDLT